MNLGICYFYEYTDNNRLRNTGFLKISKQYHTCLLNMNIRGISVKSGDSIELYAFFEQESDYISKKVGQLSCSDKNICAKLSISETAFPDNRTLEKIDGFFLKTDNGQYHAALLKDGRFNPLKVVHWQAVPVHTEEAGKTGQEPNLEVNKETTGEADEEVAEDSDTETIKTISKELNEAVDEGSGESAEVSDTTSEIHPAKTPVFGYATRSDLETAWAFEPDTETVLSPPPGDCQTLHTEADRAVPSAQNDDTADFMTDSDSPTAVNATKIQRSGLSVLPRRCWNLANNSFLMHGYHNYHHLLLVEEGDHFWLGVPGIYSPREARASEFFGFPQFTRSYNSLMNLDPDEQSESEDFGYWCRFIR